MASIVSTGIGSGLDISGIVQQLVLAEGQPVEARITQRESRTQAKLSGFGNLKAALADFQDRLDKMQDLDKFLARRAISSNEDYFTVSADTNAVPSSYALEVAQLAQAQKLTSGAFADSDAVVGTGTLTIQVGTDIIAVNIDDESNTLAGIRDAINSAPVNPGLSASIVNADSGSYLILTAEKTGEANSITITQTGGDGGLSALEYDPPTSVALTETIAAQDGLVRIDGFDIASDTNTFTGAVQGVTITAIAETGGVTESLAVANDEEATQQLLADFVDSYNILVETFDSLTNYNAEAESAAPLLGDSTIRGIRDQIRREMSAAISGIDTKFSTLRDIGIETQLDGKLQINSDELSTVLAEDFINFGQLFASSEGFATRLFELTDSFLGTGGIIEVRTKGLNSSIEEYADQRTALNERLASLETRLLRQFNALDTLLGDLNSTGNFLNQQLNNLPGFTNPGRNN